MRTAVTDRLAGALGTAAILALIGSALLLGLGVDGPPPLSKAPVLLLIEPPTAPQEAPVIPPKSARRSGRASPPNLKNRAKPVQAPPTPAVASILAAAPKPDVALADDEGAAPVMGPGQGAGGRGDGPGGGGAGDGDGGGDTPPRQIKGKLDFADIPRALRIAGVGGTVEVRYRVGATGRVESCTIDASSGSDALDMLTCALIERRFRFIPARDEAGNPVDSTIVQRHIWTNDIEAPANDFSGRR